MKNIPLVAGSLSICDWRLLFLFFFSRNNARHFCVQNVAQTSMFDRNKRSKVQPFSHLYVYTLLYIMVYYGRWARPGRDVWP